MATYHRTAIPWRDAGPAAAHLVIVVDGMAIEQGGSRSTRKLCTYTNDALARRALASARRSFHHADLLERAVPLPPSLVILPSPPGVKPLAEVLSEDA